MSNAKNDSGKLARFCCDCVKEKFAENVILLPLSPENSIADYLVICTAASEPQLNALESFVNRQVREKFDLRPLSKTGTPASGWIVLDFAGVIVHIMTEEVRDRYNLEGLWGESGDVALKAIDEVACAEVR